MRFIAETIAFIHKFDDVMSGPSSSYSHYRHCCADDMRRHAQSLYSFVHAYHYREAYAENKNHFQKRHP